MPEHRRIQRYGWKPSLPDPRDQKADPSGLPIADEVDPRHHMPRIYDQGQLGSCTANAVAAAYEYDRSLDGQGEHRPSRLFIYYCERMLEGSLGQGDTGAMGRDGFKALQHYGAPLETEWRYSDGPRKYATRPPDKVWADAATETLTKPYKAVARSVDAWRQILSNEQTIAFGFSVFESFESDQVATTGVVPLPQPGEQMLGGHEVLAVGYLADQTGYVLCRNSWGTSWGLDGYFLMPWEYVMRPDLASDFRTIVRAA